MYCDYYGFREKPFTITPNPRFLFPSRNHREALAHLRYGITNRAGFILLSGEVGTGKTTLLRTFLGELERDGYRTALIFNPCLTAQDLLKEIVREYGLPVEQLSHNELLDHLNRFLLQENAEGRTAVLVIDEAQNLPAAVLEQLRQISNLETEADKLVQIVLAGQPELEPLLQTRQLRQLNQRITVRYHLRPLDLADTRQYVVHRLVTAGNTTAGLFTGAALRIVYRASGGIPRLVNLLCDRALLIGFADELPAITARTAMKAVRETFGRVLRVRIRPVAVTAACAACLLAGVMLVKSWQHRIPRSLPSVAAPAATAGKLAALPVPPKLKTPPAPAPVPPPAAPLKPVAPSAQDPARQAVQAFNALAQAWNVAFVPDAGVTVTPASLERLARQRGLDLFRFSGGYDKLLRIDAPALLELRGTKPGSRYLAALTGFRNGRPALTPAPAGGPLTTADLKRLWTGRAFLFWKNYQEIPLQFTSGGNSVAVIRLQVLLAGAGHSVGEPTGVFDDATRAALQAFQASQGLTANGGLDPGTLLGLYRRSGKYPVPRLAGRAERGHS